jgi:hypothetical protein
MGEGFQHKEHFDTHWKAFRDFLENILINEALIPLKLQKPLHNLSFSTANFPIA